MNIHFNPAMTWGEQKGTRVLTHPHFSHEHQEESHQKPVMKPKFGHLLRGKFVEDVEVGSLWLW